MTFLPTDTGINILSNPVFFGIAVIVLVTGIILLCLYLRDDRGSGPIAFIITVVGVILFCVHLGVLTGGAVQVNETNMAANIKAKYNIDTFISHQSMGRGEKDEVEVTINDQIYTLLLTQDAATYEPVLYSGDGDDGDVFDVQSIKK